MHYSMKYKVATIGFLPFLNNLTAVEYALQAYDFQARWFKTSHIPSSVLERLKSISFLLMQHMSHHRQLQHTIFSLPDQTFHLKNCDQENLHDFSALYSVLCTFFLKQSNAGIFIMYNGKDKRVT